MKRVFCGNPTQPCWPPTDLAWNSSLTFGIPVTPPTPLVQGVLKGTCSGQWQTPLTFASVPSFLLGQAAGSPQKGGQVLFPSARLSASREASVWTRPQNGGRGLPWRKPVMLGGVAPLFVEARLAT